MKPKPNFQRVNSSFTPDFVRILNKHVRKNRLNRSKFLEQCASAVMLADSLPTAQPKRGK